MNRAYRSHPGVRCTHPVSADAPAPTVHGAAFWRRIDAFPSASDLLLINAAIERARDGEQ